VKTLVLTALLLGGCLLQADPIKVGDSLGIISTTTGKTYQGAKLTGIEPDGISILYADGGAKIPFSTLSPELQKEFGYNPEQAVEYARDQQYLDQIAQLEFENAKLRQRLNLITENFNAQGPAQPQPPPGSTFNPGSMAPEVALHHHTMDDTDPIQVDRQLSPTAQGAAPPTDPNLKPTRAGYIFFYNYLAHQGSLGTDRFVGGPYNNLTPGQLQNLAQQKWEALSYQDRLVYEQKAQMYGPGPDPNAPRPTEGDSSDPYAHGAKPVLITHEDGSTEVQTETSP
jgi:hypothetical protein